MKHPVRTDLLSASVAKLSVWRGAGRQALLFGAFGLAMAAFMVAIILWGFKSTEGKMVSPEEYASHLATLLPLGYAFGAGLVASVNPCGFLMLPAFLGYHLGLGEGKYEAEFTTQQLARSIVLGIAVTLGFVVLFSTVGSIIAAGGIAIIKIFPWAGLSVGAALVVLGGWLFVTGRSLGIPFASRIGRPQGKGFASGFLYGLAYGAASLSCTLPIFLVVVGTSLASSGLLTSLGQFISFSLGMGVVIVAVSLSAVAFRGVVSRVLSGFVPYVHRLSSIFLVGSGAYLVAYWIVLGDIFS